MKCELYHYINHVSGHVSALPHFNIISSNDKHTPRGCNVCAVVEKEMWQLGPSTTQCTTYTTRHTLHDTCYTTYTTRHRHTHHISTPGVTIILNFLCAYFSFEFVVAAIQVVAAWLFILLLCLLMLLFVAC